MSETLCNSFPPSHIPSSSVLGMEHDNGNRKNSICSSRAVAQQLNIPGRPLLLGAGRALVGHGLSMWQGFDLCWQDNTVTPSALLKGRGAGVLPCPVVMIMCIGPFY